MSWRVKKGREIDFLGLKLVGFIKRSLLARLFLTDFCNSRLRPLTLMCCLMCTFLLATFVDECYQWFLSCICLSTYLGFINSSPLLKGGICQDCIKLSIIGACSEIKIIFTFIESWSVIDIIYSCLLQTIDFNYRRTFGFL